MQIKRAHTIPTGDELFKAPQRAHADYSRAPKTRKTAEEPVPNKKSGTWDSGRQKSE